MTDRFLTIVVRNPTEEEVAQLVYHSKLSACSWSHAMEERDELMEGMDLGDPDPSNHLIGPQNPVDLANWFKREDTDDWRQHD